MRSGIKKLSIAVMAAILSLACVGCASAPAKSAGLYVSLCLPLAS